MDIVERLRIRADLKSPNDFVKQRRIETEAANKIERLRQYISELEDAIASNNPTEIFNKSARLEGLLTALKEGE